MTLFSRVIPKQARPSWTPKGSSAGPIHLHATFRKQSQYIELLLESHRNIMEARLFRVWNHFGEGRTM